MKTILIFLFILAFTLQLNAQRKVDLSIRVTRILPGGDTIKPYQLFLFDAATSYKFVFSVLCDGPDSMIAGDTIFFKTSWSNTNFYFPITYTHKKFAAQINADTGQGYIYEPNSGYMKFLPKPGASLGYLDTVIWCYDTWMVSPSSNPAIDPDISNNHRCSPPVVTKSIPVNIEQIKDHPYFLLYPNPATDALRISFVSYNSSCPQIVLRNAFGKEVYRSSFGRPLGKQYYNINVSWLPRGFYTTELYLDEKVIVRKLVLQ